MPYYSARVHIICLVDDPGHHIEDGYLCDYAFFIFWAEDFIQAFERALSLGREQETSYQGSLGDPVRWAVNEVEEIRCLGEKRDIFDAGIEVGSILDNYYPKEMIPFTTNFHPELKQPVFDDLKC